MTDSHTRAPGISRRSFGRTSGGVPVDAFTLTNGHGATVEIITYGATITRLLVPDKTGRIGDVVLGFDDLPAYESHTAYFGCVAGRVANRIAGGAFHLDAKRFTLPVNHGPNHLHGGIKGYDKRVWQAQASQTAAGPAVRCSLHDPDGAEGYPGAVDADVTYTLTSDNGLRIDYHAATTKPTPINLTNHSYFNLKDAGAGEIGGHLMKVHGGHYTPVDPTLIPTGKIDPVRGTPMDFTQPKPIGRDLKATGGNLHGFDHNLILASQDGRFARAVDVYEPDSGRHLQVWTTEPGVQLYTANYLDGSLVGKSGIRYHRHCAFCLETQHYPDSVNQPHFPGTILRPGETYRSTTEYRFSASLQRPF
jgi:aldose 1-epimerase